MSAVQSSPHTEFSISVIPARSEVIVVPVGELDLASAKRVEQAVRELRSTGFDDIVLDLRQVEFIDVSGLRMLLALRDDAERDGQGLTLLAAPERAQRIFDLTGTRASFAWRQPLRAL